MVIAYHVVFTTYGTWLPNDPRGSYSKAIYNEQLQMLGRIKYGRQQPTPAKAQLLRFWTAATSKISRPPYFIDDNSRSIIARGFNKVVQRLGIKIPACSIMNDHVHILVLRSKYRVEYIVNQLKGAATGALNTKRTLWTRGCWKVFISDNETLLSAIDYIQTNPIAAGLPAQSWDLVAPISV